MYRSVAAIATGDTHASTPENSITRVSNPVARRQTAIAKSNSTPFQVSATLHPTTPGGTIDLITPVNIPNKTITIPSPMRQIQFSSNPPNQRTNTPNQRTNTPVADRLNNRAAGKLISCGVTKDQVATTSKRELFDN